MKVQVGLHTNSHSEESLFSVALFSEWEEVFVEFDEDDDGFLDAAELGESFWLQTTQRRFNTALGESMPERRLPHRRQDDCTTLTLRCSSRVSGSRPSAARLTPLFQGT